MNRSDFAKLRLINQHLVCPSFKTPTDAVGWLGAVQAQDYAAALWAIGQRMAGGTEAAVAEAMAQAKILRTHSMRGTWHFLSAEDIRWFLDLTGPRQVARFAPILRKLELDEPTLTRSMAIIEHMLLGGKQLLRRELAAALDRAGIDAPELRMGAILAYGESIGLIASGARRGKQFTYALLDELAPQARRLAREESLAELTRRYFASHGPAMIKDFVWWSGLTVAGAKAGLTLAENNLTCEEIDGESYWFAPSSAEAHLSEPSAFLLPPFDEFTVAYKDRRAFQHPEHIEETRNPFINLGPVIVIDGRVVGTWKRALGKGSVTVALRPFGQLGYEETEAVHAAAQRYASFLGLPIQLI